MLRRSTVVAINRVGKVSQRPLCLSAVLRKEVTPSDTKGAEAEVEIIEPNQYDLKTYTYRDMPQEVKDQNFPNIGNRDIVGPTYALTYDYQDAVDYNMPCVRWAANTPEVLALRQKEMGDWNALSLEEKKQLYRNAYRQTLAEVLAPTGDWKRILYLFLYISAISTIYFMYFTETCPGGCNPPRTLTKEYQQELVASMLMRNLGHFSGLSSKYDFDKNEWKK